MAEALLPLSDKQFGSRKPRLYSTQNVSSTGKEAGLQPTKDVQHLTQTTIDLLKRSTFSFDQAKWEAMHSRHRSFTWSRAKEDWPKTGLRMLAR
eukprot:m.104781 g.104781  ORF g.104781 m.104781 type:complete len:94 (+) comp37213_c0_seq1:180-461(+)